MSVLATDNFNRADNADLGANWDLQTGEWAFNIVSNTVVNSTDGADCAENYNAVTWPDDQYSQVKISGIGGVAYSDGDGPGVAVRMSPSARTYYRAIMRDAASGNVHLDKIITGTATPLTTFTATYVDGAVLYLGVQGTTLTVKYNGSTLGTFSDSAIASGRAGLAYSADANGRTATFDDWEGGDFTGGGGSPRVTQSMTLMGVQ